ARPSSSPFASSRRPRKRRTEKARASRVPQDLCHELVRGPGRVEAQYGNIETGQPALVLRPAASRLGAVLILRRPFDELAVDSMHRPARQQRVAEPALLAPPEPLHPNF